MGGSRGGGGYRGSGPSPPGKSQVAIDFLRKNDKDPPRDAIGPIGPIASRGRFVRPSVKYSDD